MVVIHLCVKLGVFGNITKKPYFRHDRVKNWALIITCYVLTLFFIHTTSTCIVRLGDICNALRYSSQYLISVLHPQLPHSYIVCIFLKLKGADTQFQKLQLKIEYANNVTVRQLRMKNTY
jgi:hypothetical protein